MKFLTASFLLFSIFLSADPIYLNCEGKKYIIEPEKDKATWIYEWEGRERSATFELKTTSNSYYWEDFHPSGWLLSRTSIDRNTLVFTRDNTVAPAKGLRELGVITRQCEVEQSPKI